MTAPKLKHPFIDGLQDKPEHKKKEMLKIKSWMNTQPHLPQVSEDYIYLFLHASYYNLDKTKECIENYFTIRANTPILFADRDPCTQRMQTLASLAHLVRLPKCTPEGYRVLLYGVRDPDPTKVVFNDAVKGFCMYNDCVLSEDGLVDGYIVIFDMKGISLGHLARVSLPAVRAFMLYIQEAHPCRLKAIHIVNTASWIHHIMRIVLPLIKSEMLSLVKFHKSNVPEDFPVELLPSDYGGESPSMEELDNVTKGMIDKYAPWLIESVHFQADETKRVRKSNWWGIFGGSTTNGSTNTNGGTNGKQQNGRTNADELDEKTFLKNLQID